MPISKLPTNLERATDPEYIIALKSTDAGSHDTRTVLEKKLKL